MHRVLFFYLYFILALFNGESHFANAQLPHEIDAANGHDELYFRHITRENGLPSSVVRYITQDFLGYMWFATDNGLVRFDGSKMKIFQYIPGDSTSITESTIITLFESSDSLLWIGTINGFSIYDPFSGKFENHKNIPDDKLSFPGTEVRSFWEDRDKTIWIGTNNGIVHYNRSKKAYALILANNNPAHDRVMHFKYIYKIIEDPRDRSKLLITTAGGLIQLNKANYQLTKDYEKDEKKFYRSESLYIEGDSVLWTGEWATGLKRFDLKRETWEIFHFSKELYGTVLSITGKSTDELWIATDLMGLAVFNKKEKSFDYYKNNPANPKSILSNTVHCNLFIDKHHNLWFGGQEGINILDKQYRSFRKMEIPMEFERLRSFFRDKKSRKLYFGVSGEQNLIVWDEKKTRWDFVLHDPREVVPYARVTHIYKDRSGRIWVGTMHNTLLYLDSLTNKLKLFRTPDGNPLKLKNAQTINYLIEDKNRNLWASTAFDGVIKINSDRTEVEYFRHDSTNLNSLNYGTHHFEIELDKAGRLWIGSYQGFDVYDIQKQIFRHDIADTLQYLGIKSSNAYSFECDTLGRMWVALSGEGILRVTERNGRFEYKIFHVQHGFSDLNIGRIASDPEGNFWIINEGLVKFNPYDESVQVYDKRNGLWNTKSYDDRIYIDYEGNIFLHNDNAYETSNYKELDITSGIINLIIEELEVNGSRRLSGVLSNHAKPYTFEAGANNLNFTFSAICFQDIDQILYSYKLKGYSKEWSIPGKQSNARYINLPPGQYEFIVKVAHRGVWLSDQKSIKFSIKPFFWQATWFKIFVILLILVMFYLVYQIKIRQIKREEKIKTEFQHKIAEVEMQALRAQMNPHFIFNSLNSINNFILKNESELASDFLTKFSRLVRQVLSNSRNKLVSLEDEFAALKLYIELEQLRFNHKFSYRVDIDHYLDVNLVLIPPLLIQPYVENAIWHGLMNKESEGHISIRAYQDNEKLFFEILDDGIGRKKAAEYKSRFGIAKKSLGMDITSDRIAILNKMFKMEASFEILDLYDCNQQASGTKVLISIPVITKETNND